LNLHTIWVERIFFIKCIIHEVWIKDSKIILRYFTWGKKTIFFEVSIHGINLSIIRKGVYTEFFEAE